jgi:thiol-disulfide isomerase/thioredoxin
MRWISLFLSAFVVACSDADSAGEKAMQPMLGKNLAEVEVQTLEGQFQPFKTLLAEADGRPVVVNVWATWCPPCIEEMPELDALGRSGKARVVAIATDASATVVKDYLRTQTWGQGMEIWFDAHGRTTREALRARALPTSVVLDSSLTVVYGVAGPKKWMSEAMAKKMKPAL